MILIAKIIVNIAIRKGIQNGTFHSFASNE